MSADKLYFVIDEKNNQVELTDNGLALITRSGEDPEFFVLPDIATKLSEIEKTDLTTEEKLQRKENLLNEYSLKAERIHTVQQLLKAYTLFDKDVEYVVMDGAVKIVDEQTGRILDGRRYSDGLHQAIEAKENVKIEASTQTYATVTLQNYFRMYHKLAGMTGTALTESEEFEKIYNLEVVAIPTNLPIIRKDFEDLIYMNEQVKFKAVVDEIKARNQRGQPVLVGTVSIEKSEELSAALKKAGIPHNVLNARFHDQEAQIARQLFLGDHGDAGQGDGARIGRRLVHRDGHVAVVLEARAGRQR